jgi:O-antigen/teichoic acid export membrane protein
VEEILKNTIILYIRMAFIMGLNLYTVRIVLKALGIQDYGIYDVVAGVVNMLSFLSQTMSISTQRFFSYALGEKKQYRLNQIFNLSFFIFVILSIVVVIILETLGLWFTNTYLNIPKDRMYAANCIFQFAIVAFVFTMLSVPYTSVIIANEDMKLYAFIGILNYLLILIFTLSLDVVKTDKLIFYGFSIACVSCIVFFIYYWRCRMKYKECRFKICKDKKLFKEMMSYSWWTLYGSIAGIANNQGNNTLINIFFGPITNSARAIALQLGGALGILCTNLFMAVRPPLIKYYAIGDRVHTMRLFYTSNKLSFYMIFIICLPLYLEMEYILNLWLPEVTFDMIVFTRLSVIYTFILSLQNSITTLIQATGNVKKYSLFVESFTILSLPLTYLFFKLGFSAKYTFLIGIYLFSAAHIIRLVILKINIAQFTLTDYFVKFALRSIFVCVASCAIPIFLENHLPSGAGKLITVSISTVIITLSFVCLIGLSDAERRELFNYIQLKVKHARK